MIRERIREIERHVPEEFLVKCEWGPPLKEATHTAVIETMLKHHENAVECYLRHNSWVEFHKRNSDNLNKGKVDGE